MQDCKHIPSLVMELQQAISRGPLDAFSVLAHEVVLTWFRVAKGWRVIPSPYTSCIDAPITGERTRSCCVPPITAAVLSSIVSLWRGHHRSICFRGGSLTNTRSTTLPSRLCLRRAPNTTFYHAYPSSVSCPRFPFFLIVMHAFRFCAGECSTAVSGAALADVITGDPSLSGMMSGLSVTAGGEERIDGRPVFYFRMMLTMVAYRCGSWSVSEFR